MGLLFVCVFYPHMQELKKKLQRKWPGLFVQDNVIISGYDGRNRVIS